MLLPITLERLTPLGVPTGQHHNSSLGHFLPRIPQSLLIYLLIIHMTMFLSSHALHQWLANLHWNTCLSRTLLAIAHHHLYPASGCYVALLKGVCGRQALAILGSSEDGNELEGASDGEVGINLEDGIDHDDELADTMGVYVLFDAPRVFLVMTCGFY